MNPFAASAAGLSTLLAAGDDPLSHIMPHEIGELLGQPITNHVLMLFVSAILLLIVMPIVARGQSLVPTGFRNMIEAVLQFLREDMARPVLGQATDKLIPFIWTLFFLILTANLLGMIPIGSFAAPIDDHLKHIGGTATGNLSITAALAICAFLFIHISGMREKGVGTYWNDFFFGHAPIWLSPLMIPLEIAGALVKPFALAIRLFANMIAGHVVLAVLLGFAAVGLMKGGAMIGITGASVLGAVFISLLELLVAFLQAYIFTFLTTLFVGMAIEPSH